MAAGSGSITWTPHPNVLRLRVEALSVAFFERLGVLLDTVAARGESLAKTGAPWTDRTGAARSGLRGTSDVGATESQVVLSYNVDYGMWLELANQGRYATVIPTMQVMVGELGNGLRGLLG